MAQTFKFSTMIEAAGPEIEKDIREAETGYIPLPGGTYRAVVTDTEYKVSGSGNEMIIVKYAVVEPEAWAGKAVRDNIVFQSERSEKGAKFFFLKLAALGWTPAKLRELEQPVNGMELDTTAQIHAIAAALKGRNVQIVTKLEPGNDGRMWPNVSFVNPDRGPGSVKGPKDTSATATGALGGVPSDGRTVTAPSVQQAPSVPAAASIPSIPTPNLGTPAGL